MLNERVAVENIDEVHELPLVDVYSLYKETEHDVLQGKLFEVVDLSFSFYPIKESKFILLSDCYKLAKKLQILCIGLKWFESI